MKKSDTELGRPPEISNESIISAGLKIESEGKPVSGYRLRQKIGRGDPKRLEKVWQVYKDQQGIDCVGGLTEAQELAINATVEAIKLELTAAYLKINT